MVILQGPYLLNVFTKEIIIINQPPKFVQEPSEFYILSGEEGSFLIGNIVDDEGDKFGYDG